MRPAIYLALAALLVPAAIASSRVAELTEPATPARGRSLRGRSLVQQTNLLTTPLPGSIPYSPSLPNGQDFLNATCAPEGQGCRMYSWH